MNELAENFVVLTQHEQSVNLNNSEFCSKRTEIRKPFDHRVLPPEIEDSASSSKYIVHKWLNDNRLYIEEQSPPQTVPGSPNIISAHHLENQEHGNFAGMDIRTGESVVTKIPINNISGSSGTDKYHQPAFFERTNKYNNRAENVNVRKRHYGGYMDSYSEETSSTENKLRKEFHGTSEAMNLTTKNILLPDSVYSNTAAYHTNSNDSREKWYLEYLSSPINTMQDMQEYSRKSVPEYSVKPYYNDSVIDSNRIFPDNSNTLEKKMMGNVEFWKWLNTLQVKMETGAVRLQYLVNRHSEAILDQSLKLVQLKQELEPHLHRLQEALDIILKILPRVDYIELEYEGNAFKVKREAWEKACSKHTIKDSAIALVECDLFIPKTEKLSSTSGRHSVSVLNGQQLKPLDPSKMNALFRILADQKRLGNIQRSEADVQSSPNFLSTREQKTVKEALAQFFNQYRQKEKKQRLGDLLRRDPATNKQFMMLAQSQQELLTRNCILVDIKPSTT